MIPNEAIINVLRQSLGFEFKDQKDRVMIYKKRGDTQRVMVRRITLHDDNAARILLKQAGMSADEIEKFINTYRCNEH